MNVEPLVLFLVRMLTEPEEVWNGVFGEKSAPAAGIILVTVTVGAIAAQISLIYRAARRGEHTLEDSESDVNVYLPVTARRTSHLSSVPS